MNLRIKLLTYLGCWLFFSSFIRTLNHEQSETADSQLTSAELFDRGFGLINEDVETADSLVSLAWSMALVNQDPLGIAKGYFYKGCVFDRKMMLDSAIYHLEKSIQLAVPLNAWDNVPDAYGRIGLLLFKKNRTQEGLEYLINGIKIAEAEQNEASIVRLSIVLAMHHNDFTAHFQEAINYLQKAEASALEMNDVNLLGHIYLQKSISYQRLNRVEEAENHAQRSLQSFRYIKSSYNEMRAMFTLAGIFSMLGESDKLSSILEQVKPLLHKNPDDLLQANYDKLHSESVFIQGNFKEALRLAKQSSILFKNGGQTQGVLELDKLQARIYYALGDIAKADSMYYQAQAMNDSIYSARAYSIDSELRQQFDSDTKQHRIDMQQMQIKHDRILRYALFGLLILLAVLAITLYKRYAFKKRLIHLNEILLNEVNHRVKNNLQLLSSILNMQNRKLETQEAKDLVKKSLARMKTFTIIHDTLYMQNSMDRIDMKSFLIQVCDGSETADGQAVQVHIEANGVDLKVDFAMHIGLIINELVTNTCKYAFSGQTVERLLSTYDDVMIALENSPPVNEIKIVLQRTQALTYEIRYQDNGPGMEELNLSTPKSMGMKIICGLVRQMQGTVDYNQHDNQFLIRIKTRT